MWGLFAGEARKQPPHIPFSTAIPKDPVKDYDYNLFEPIRVGRLGTRGRDGNYQHSEAAPVHLNFIPFHGRRGLIVRTLKAGNDPLSKSF